VNDAAQKIQPATIIKQIEVDSSPERAFDIFAAHMGQWWHKGHSIARGTSQKDVIVERRAGGRWYELGADGSEHQWGEVIEYDPPRRLLLAWRLNREFIFDPDLHTEVDVRFEPHGTGTRVHFEHRFLERMGEGTVELLEGMDGGWGMLLGLFRAQVEQAS
jgi:uncharacterized protein YndB with AHSA1/START domain